MKGNPKNNKKGKIPSFMYILLTFTLGVFIRNASFDVTSCVYVAGFLTVFILPYFAILNQDAQEMKRIELLVQGLEGGE